MIKRLQTAFFLGLLILGSAVCCAVDEGDDNQNQDFDVVICLDNRKVPPTKLSQDDYVLVAGTFGVKIPSYVVKDVIYAAGNNDGDYTNALRLFTEKKYPAAARDFLNAMKNLKDEKWAAEYCNYMAATALYEGGHFLGYKGKTTTFDPPSVYYKKMLEIAPKSRFMPDAIVKYAICLAQEDRLQEAETAVKAAEDRIKSYRDETAKIHTGYAEVADRALAQLASARGYIAERRALGGKETWKNVRDFWALAESRSKKFPEQEAEAVDGELRAMVMDGDFQGAIEKSDEFIDKYKRTGEQKLLLVLPGAYTAKGQAKLALAFDYEKRNRKGDANLAFAEARWAFLHVIAQFFDNDEYVAKAHYFAGMCYDRLRDVEPGDAAEKAIRHWKLVTQKFPKSAFAEEARKALKAAGADGDASKSAPAPGGATPAAPATAAPAAAAPPAAPAAK